MKKLVVAIISSFFISSIYAADTASMRAKVNDNIKNTHYICVSNVGCVNLAAATKGKSFPMQSGEVSHIFLVDAKTLRMYPQSLPTSCNVNIKSNETLIISGKVTNTKDNIYINNLHCAVKAA